MAQYKVIVDLFSNLVELKEQALFGNVHEVELEPSSPVVNDQSFSTYEEEAIGTVVGDVVCSDNNVTWEILAGNTGNAFTINSSTGIITTAAILQYETLSSYSLTVRATSVPFPTFSDTGVITITVLQMYHICVNNGVNQSGTSVDNQVNYLSYNEIQLLSGGTLGDYLIEWKLDSITGTTVFRSGNIGNTDVDIQASHPFYEPTQAGVLYPVFRYIEVDSVMYTGIRLSGYGLYSADLATCLTHKHVLAMTCSNGATGSTYDHVITYTNASMLPAAATRSVSYALNEDGSTKQFAWSFYGYVISDRITISYMSGVNKTVIEDWVVGTDSVANNFVSTPKIYKQTLIATVFSLTGFTYITGDYLLIEISPSYNRPSETDTNWQFSTKCLTEAGSGLVDTSFASGDITTITDTGSTLTLSWNASLCRYELAVHTLSGITSSKMTQYYWWASYFGYSDFDTDSSYPLAFNTGYTFTWANTAGNDYLLNGQLVINRNLGTNTMTYDFTNQADYLVYKNSYATITGSTCWSNYSTNPQNTNNYKDIATGQLRISMTSGDTYTTVNLYYDHDAVFTFDDANYIITIGMVSKAVPYSGETCNTFGDGMRNHSTYINNTYSGASQTWNTIWGKSRGFEAKCYLPAVQAQTDVSFSPSYGVTTGIVSSTLPLGPRFFASGDMMHFYKISLRVVITNLGDPINNYEVYNRLNPDGSLSGSWTLIKKVGT